MLIGVGEGTVEFNGEGIKPLRSPCVGIIIGIAGGNITASVVLAPATTK